MTRSGVLSSCRRKLCVCVLGTGAAGTCSEPGVGQSSLLSEAAPRLPPAPGGTEDFPLAVRQRAVGGQGGRGWGLLWDRVPGRVGVRLWEGRRSAENGRSSDSLIFLSAELGTDAQRSSRVSLNMRVRSVRYILDMAVHLLGYHT